MYSLRVILLFSWFFIFSDSWTTKLSHLESPPLSCRLGSLSGCTLPSTLKSAERRPCLWIDTPPSGSGPKFYTRQLSGRGGGKLLRTLSVAVDISVASRGLAGRIYIKRRTLYWASIQWALKTGWQQRGTLLPWRVLPIAGCMYSKSSSKGNSRLALQSFSAWRSYCVSSTPQERFIKI